MVVDQELVLQLYGGKKRHLAAASWVDEWARTGDGSTTRHVQSPLASYPGPLGVRG